MKHQITDDVVVKLELPTQDLEQLVDKVTESAIIVMGFYMVANTTCHILKSLMK